jgi:hypothetical protein
VRHVWIPYTWQTPKGSIEARGKKSSPLDYVHVDTWDASWTTELVDLLTVLTRLVELEPAQADVLDRIAAGPVHTLDSLQHAGVRWPATSADRRPHRGFEAVDGQPVLELG